MPPSWSALPTFRTCGWCFPALCCLDSTGVVNRSIKQGIAECCSHLRSMLLGWPHYPQVEVWFKIHSPQDVKWFQPVWDWYQCDGNGMAGSSPRGPMKAATSSESPNKQTVLSLTDSDSPTGKKARVSQTRQEVVHWVIHDRQKNRWSK